jgi:hypothetical protein
MSGLTCKALPAGCTTTTTTIINSFKKLLLLLPLLSRVLLPNSSVLQAHIGV